MNQNTNMAYTFDMASIEIISLVLLAFILGTLLCWLLRRLGICCRISEPKRNIPSTTGKPLSTSVTTPSMGKMTVTTPAMAKPVVKPVNVSTPNLATKVTTPSVTSKAVDFDWLSAFDPHKPIIDAPEGTIGLGDVELKTKAPKFDLPDIDLKVPGIALAASGLAAAASKFKADLPDINLPKPDIKLPDVDLPKIPDVSLPDVELPKFGFKAPEIDLPDVDLPKIPDVDLKVPDVSLPDVATAEVRFQSS
ncbi:MAG: neuroblast differentiation-associated protein isoform [Pseudomonadota bacterium]